MDIKFFSSCNFMAAPSDFLHDEEEKLLILTVFLFLDSPVFLNQFLL